MKWFALPLIAALFAAPCAVSAQEFLPIGRIPIVDDRSPTTWGMSGMEMVRVLASVGDQTPITRSLAWDARTVEILSRTQAPPLRARDIRRVSRDGREFIVVRRYMLLEAMPQDARAASTTRRALADKWAESIRRVLPQVAPTPSRFGI